MFNTNYSNKEDIHIWRAFINGEESALSYIYFQYAKSLMLYGYKICQNKQLVEDKIHDLFLELWTKHERLGSTDSIRFYLFKSLRRKLAESVKADKLRYALGVEMIDQVSGPFELQMVNIETASERKKLVATLLAHLNDNQRDILHLKYTAGLSNGEIAEVLEMEIQSVKNALFRAITKIRKYINQHNIPFPLMEGK